MSSTRIAIICKGKEITYGLNLFRLFHFKNENVKFCSDWYDDVVVEMYSVAVFCRSNISQKNIRLFIGEAKNMDATYKRIFYKFGMSVYCSEMNYVLKVDDKQLKEYDNFILYANTKRREYFELEKEYTKKVEDLDANWIVKEFKPQIFKRMFCKRNAKVQQMYDCLAFVVYLEILRNEKEWMESVINGK